MLGEWMKMVKLMVTVQCSGFAVSVPKADQDTGRERCLGRLPKVVDQLNFRRQIRGGQVKR